MPQKAQSFSGLSFAFIAPLRDESSAPVHVGGGSVTTVPTAQSRSGDVPSVARHGAEPVDRIHAGRRNAMPAVRPHAMPQRARSVSGLSLAVIAPLRDESSRLCMRLHLEPLERNEYGVDLTPSRKVRMPPWFCELIASLREASSAPLRDQRRALALYPASNPCRDCVDLNGTSSKSC